MSLSGEESGFTLVELLVAMVLGLIILGASVMVFTSASKNQPRATSRTADIQEARTGMERVVRELRQGSLASGTSSQLTVTYPQNPVCGGSCTVVYTCASGNCSRTQGGMTRILVTGLASNSVFGYSVCPAEPTKINYISVTMPFRASNGDDSITLTDGVRLRNQCMPR
jgi:prepilin-type N-terminal cleavage/methylation domain-containing protein